MSHRDFAGALGEVRITTDRHALGRVGRQALELGEVGQGIGRQCLERRRVGLRGRRRQL
jgi:hypothetical protein